MEAFLEINGKKFPFPKRGLQMQVMTIVDSGRSASGRIIAQRVGRDQQKLNSLVWPVLDGDTWREMLQEFEKFDLTVRYPDPAGGGWTTRAMYPGDRSAEPYWLNEDGTVRMYINCSCNLIDRGESRT